MLPNTDFNVCSQAYPTGAQTAAVQSSQPHSRCLPLPPSAVPASVLALPAYHTWLLSLVSAAAHFFVLAADHSSPLFNFVASQRIIKLPTTC